jgi:FKBP-type peptidyl-prolyl cis-trans isomerase SlyD
MVKISRRIPPTPVAGFEGVDVLLDANHPLAGVDLTFDVDVVAVRPATAREIEHGHVHAGGGDCDVTGSPGT